MDEIRQREDVILFIDEIHEIVGAGSAGEGNMDAGNILKTSLSAWRTPISRCYYLNEYRIIEKMRPWNVGCSPLRSMNQRLKKPSPSSRASRKIRRLPPRPLYRRGHRSGSYSFQTVTSKIASLPDKAIDLLDEAGSKMNLTLNFVDPKVIDQRLIEAENLKAQATREEDFEKQPTSVTKSRNTRKCKGQHVTDQETPVISEKPSSNC